MAERLAQTGISPDRITIRPSWVPDAGPVTEPGTELLFVGRLDEAKGVRLLLDAWRIAGPGSGRVLRIAGDGPLRAEVEAAAAASCGSIRYEGWVNAARVNELMDQAAAVVVPSLCFEGYPLVVAQAFGRGRGVLTVTGGSAASIVAQGGGWATEPTVISLARAITDLRSSEAGEQGSIGRLRFLSENSPEAGLDSLMHAYRTVNRSGDRVR
jgi:glycosyltransferase involved in cell wall biosynthesis